MSNPNPSPATRFKHGDNRNRGPRETIGAAIVRCMCGLRKKSKGYIEAVAADETEKIYRRIAAKRVLAGFSDDKPGTEFVMDYTSGLPSRDDKLTISAEPRTESERAEARDRALARIRGRLNRPA